MRISTRHRRGLAVLALVVGLWLLARATGLADRLTLAGVRELFALHPLGGLALFALAFTMGNLAQVPGTVFMLAAVLALGRFWGGLATYAGASVACLAAFTLLRAVGGDALRGLHGRWARRLFRQLDARPVRSVIGLRMLFQTLPALNLALALSGVGWRAHLVGTLLGLPLPIACYVLAFDQLARWLHWPLTA